MVNEQVIVRKASPVSKGMRPKRVRGVKVQPERSCVVCRESALALSLLKVDCDFTFQSLNISGVSK